MSELFEKLIEKRGFKKEFLKPRYEDLANPWLLPDMDKAISRIKSAIKNKEKIIVYGDYDADGVTASTLISEVFSDAGAESVEVMLPDRFKDGYGMSNKVIQRAKETGAKLVVTVDCGSSNNEVVESLKKEGVDTIVTDHHECPSKLPNAIAVVNPKRRDVKSDSLDESGFKELAGVGVAFMVARALASEKMIREGQEKWLLDLVLIGTICDSMKMTIANRILCFYGMKVLGKTRRVGLKELMKVAGTKEITSESIGFQIGPRINAAGRMAKAEIALDLLRTTSRTEASQLANKLQRLNADRKNQQGIAMAEFEKRGLPKDKVIVVTGEWHEGVLGIIAGRLVEEYRRPAFVLTQVDNDVFKGSGRSFGDFSLADALKACSDFIVGGGGHAGAAGVKVSKEKLELFSKKINEYYDSLKLVDQEKFFAVKPDVRVSNIEGFTLDFLDEIKQLEPFGPGNEVPIFELKKVTVLDKRLLGADEQHVRLLVRDADGNTMKVLAFNAPEDWREVEDGSRVDAFVNVEENCWNGLRSVEGRILDLRGC